MEAARCKHKVMIDSTRGIDLVSVAHALLVVNTFDEILPVALSRCVGSNIICIAASLGQLQQLFVSVELEGGELVIVSSPMGP